ncbi:GPI8 [Symbiodinium microadriaticum]|nr:GPI8 [Symbiodinium microadriaticum]
MALAYRLVLFAVLGSLVYSGPADHGDTTSRTERNNWAVLVETSRYWYNYRHAANTLSFYHTVKRLGIPDSQIILMMAEDMPCNSRNARPGTVFNEKQHRLNLYGEDVEVDYRGDEVSVENFLRLLTGRHAPSTPRNKRLLTDSSSNIFIFITGHSGEEFIKFQDWEELTSNDIADAFKQMQQQRRYKQIFWVSDTCQAATLQNQFYSPGILAYGSSGKKENSYSHHIDHELGVAVIDRFTFHALDKLNSLASSSSETVRSFTSWFNPKLLKAHPELRADLFGRDPGSTLLTEFMASTGRPRFQDRLLPVAASPDQAPSFLGLSARQRNYSLDASIDKFSKESASFEESWEAAVLQLYMQGLGAWEELKAKTLLAVEGQLGKLQQAKVMEVGLWLAGFGGISFAASAVL